MRKLALLSVLLVVAAMGWRKLHRRDVADPKLLFDRFWVDHEAAQGREEFQALFVAGEQPLGTFQTRTWWTGRWELFHYHVLPREEGVLDTIFPTSGERQRVHYRARRCDEKGFDFCLEIDGNSRGAHRYFSKKEWATKTGDVVELFADVRERD